MNWVWFLSLASGKFENNFVKNWKKTSGWKELKKKFPTGSLIKKYALKGKYFKLPRRGGNICINKT